MPPDRPRNFRDGPLSFWCKTPQQPWLAQRGLHQLWVPPREDTTGCGVSLAVEPPRQQFLGFAPETKLKLASSTWPCRAATGDEKVGSAVVVFGRDGPSG